MERIISVIRSATAALPTGKAIAADTPRVTARDWIAFFQALADFAAALIPRLIPLFIATVDDE